MAASSERATQATDYVVLEQRTFKEDGSDEKTEAWVEVGASTSTTRTGAVSEIAEDREGIWRPVPTRNWRKPIRTRTKTETKMVVEEIEDET